MKHCKSLRVLLPLLMLLELPLMPVRAQLVCSAEIRPRILTDLGYASPKIKGTPALVYVTQRTRLNVRFSQGMFESYISFQDVRLWGGDDNYRQSGSYGNTGSLSLHQGWFLLQPASWISLKVGRQVFSYDDQRIISARNWNDYQVTYDALLVKLEQGDHRLDLGLSRNSESKTTPFYPVRKFRAYDFLRYQLESGRLQWSAIALITGNTLSDTTSRVRYRATWGTNLLLQTAGFQARSAFYYQHHLNRVGGRISAWACSLKLGSKLLSGRLKWSTGVDYISGREEPSSSGTYPEKDHAFDLLYGRRHGWYGYMDYFSNMPSQGLQDYLVQLEFLPGEEISLGAAYHLFWLAAPLADPEAPGLSLKQRLGDELDVTLNWKISDLAKLQAGYSFFIPRPTLEVLKDLQGERLKFPQFAYLMITLTPGFSFPVRSE